VLFSLIIVSIIVSIVAIVLGIYITFAFVTIIYLVKRYQSRVHCESGNKWLRFFLQTGLIQLKTRSLGPDSSRPASKKRHKQFWSVYIDVASSNVIVYRPEQYLCVNAKFTGFTKYALRKAIISRTIL